MLDFWGENIFCWIAIDDISAGFLCQWNFFVQFPFGVGASLLPLVAYFIKDWKRWGMMMMMMMKMMTTVMIMIMMTMTLLSSSSSACNWQSPSRAVCSFSSTGRYQSLLDGLSPRTGSRFHHCRHHQHHLHHLRPHCQHHHHWYHHHHLIISDWKKQEALDILKSAATANGNTIPADEEVLHHNQHHHPLVIDDGKQGLIIIIILAVVVVIILVIVIQMTEQLKTFYHIVLNVFLGPAIWIDGFAN